MRKGKLVILSLITVLVLTGCGKKELTCTMDQSAEGTTVSQTMNVTIDGNKIKDMSAIVNVELSDAAAASKDLLKSTYEALGFKSEDTDKGLKFTADKDSKFIKEALDADEKTSYDDAKKQLEDLGYKCK